ncbi:Pal1-domain-containing protein [Hypoxylon sp. FL1284]|nr:Pal1-domain-containing protein [Hypoxylon sp. FL1284]
MAAHSSDLLGLYDNSPPTQSASLTLNLSSNNPFRNRAASPNLPPSPHSPFDDPPPRPTSRNPFLDPSGQQPPRAVSSPDNMATSRDQKSPSAEELFDNLIIDDKEAKPRSGPGRPPANRPPGGPPRGENNPPRGRGPPPPSSHRPTRSQEEALRARRMHSASNGGDKAMNVSPHKRPGERRPRRNSDSSTMEKPLTDEEKKAREIRRRERERRHREREGRDKPKTGRKLDIIDQLDATGIYGAGLFHHDGPFDACNPHRNRKGSRRAPMQAFAKDSANNSMGGSGPLTQRPDHKQFMGQEPHEASVMFGKAKEKSVKGETTLFDPKQANEFVAGEETLGLGSSTFLEGAPAARTAIQRSQAEEAQEVEQGLGRKKSVVQRFRSIKRPPREPRQYSDGGRITSPDGNYTPRTGDPSGEGNPFFAEFDKAEERISVKRTDSNPISPPLASAPLERRTADESPTSAKSPDGNGFLSRVRSLKGGRRQRPEPPTQELPPAPGMAI